MLHHNNIKKTLNLNKFIFKINLNLNLKVKATTLFMKMIYKIRLFNVNSLNTFLIY